MVKLDMSIESPELGEIRTAKELGLNSPYKWMWALCETCQKPRWVRTVRGEIISKHCKDCGRPINPKRLHVATEEEISQYNPSIGDIRYGNEVGLKCKALYIWNPCPRCNKPKWALYKNRVAIYTRCKKCSNAVVKAKLLGTQRTGRILNTTAPQLGEIRWGDEIGCYGKYSKWVWHACMGCGKERWVTLTTGDIPQNQRCSTCAKLGTIKNKSLSPTRKCSKCHTEYPSTTDYFYRAKRSHKGISCTCKWCRNKQIAKNTTKRLRSDPQFRLRVYFSKSITDSLKGIHRNCSWEKLLGYTTKDLMHHLESQFTEGMSWDNYGVKGWVVDHRIPQSAFCFTKLTDIDFGRCWSLDNLQPMFFIPNSRKGNRIDEPFQPSLPITVNETEETYVHQS